MRRKNNLIVLAALLFVFGVLLRLLPHPANVTPLTAIALFAGVYFRGKRALLLPVLTMVISDLFLGWHNLVLFTWGSFAAVVGIGMWVRRRKSPGSIAVGTIAGSTLFYLVTNFAVWAFTPLYEKSVSGLLASYTMAIPFFRNMVIGDVFYTALLFGAMELAVFLSRRLSQTREKSGII